MVSELVRHTRILEIVGDTLRVRAKNAAFGELALVENSDGTKSLARVVGRGCHSRRLYRMAKY